MESKVLFLDLMDQGGPIMWVLLGFSILAAAVTIQKALALGFAQRRDRQFQRRFAHRLRTGRPLSSVVSKESAPVGPLETMINEGLRQPAGDLESVEAALTTAAYRELKRLRRGLGVLATTANLAPLLGFLGTVMGMMISFDAIADAGLQQPGLVANGIKEALTTTAAGLAVAIPVQLAHNVLIGQLDEVAHRLETAGDLLLQTLGRRTPSLPQV